MTSALCATISASEAGLSGRSCPTSATAPSEPKQRAAQRLGRLRRRSQRASETAPRTANAAALTYFRMSLT